MHIKKSPQTRKHKQCGKKQNCKENERSETEQDAKLQKTFQQHLIKTVHICNRQKVKTFTRKQKKGKKKTHIKSSYLVNHRRFCGKITTLREGRLRNVKRKEGLGVISTCLPAEWRDFSW